MRHMLATVLITVFSLGLLLGCGGNAPAQTEQSAEKPKQTFKWKMVTSWPKNFPGLGQAPETFARYVNAMSDGRLEVKVYGAGQLVPGLEVFDAVAAGTAEMGHSGAYYWKGKMPAAPIFSAIPFGMNAQEMNGWLHYGGGLEMWQALYKPFGVIPFAGGSTGVQTAGWFKKEINSVEDLKGLKMRIPGLGGDVLKKVGGLPVTLTGGELFTALQTGAIDATEWVGPYNDLAFGLYKAADYFYYSGWHEPSTMLEFIVNEAAFNSLPDDLKAIVKVAMRAANQDMLDEYTARNNDALQTLLKEHHVALRALPDDVIQTLKKATQDVMAEQVAADAQFASIYQSYSDFFAKVKNFHSLTEAEYYHNR